MSSRLRTSPYPRIGSKRGHPRRLLGHRVHDGLVADMTLILVSNRLPVTIRRVGNRLDVQPNPGGVAAGPPSIHRELRGRSVRWPGSIAPGAIKQSSARSPEARIGSSPHITSPPYDVFRLLPWHKKILQGMLGADLIGFHTYDYARAFLGSLLRDLGLDNRIGAVVAGHRAVQVDVFPLGVDVTTFNSTSIGPSAARSIARLRKGVEPSKLLFSISRLDYTKGIPEALEAFGRFLEVHPEWRRKITYFLAVVPSRERAAQYARLKRTIDERAGRINSRYSTIAWSPIRYVYRQLDFDELLALYRVSAGAIVTPLRDGMNLIAKEYVAAKQEPRRALILSEMAGASKEMREALIVNPNDVEDVVGAIHRALSMRVDEQAARIRAMQERLRRYDARTWATRFLERLEDAVRMSQDLAAKDLSDRHRKEIRHAYRQAGRRLLLLDYDGTQ